MAAKGSVYFDIPKIKIELIKYFTAVIEKFAKTAIEYIAIEIPIGESHEWPGVWRDNVKNMLKPLATEI